jgi:hypothetical protein
MIAVTPRDLERERLDEQRFAELAETTVRELGERAPTGKSFAEFFEKRPVGAPAVLSDLRREADLRSVLVAVRVQAQARSGTPQYMLSTATLMRVRGKMLSISVHTAYEGPADSNGSAHHRALDRQPPAPQRPLDCPCRPMPTAPAEKAPGSGSCTGSGASSSPTRGTPARRASSPGSGSRPCHLGACAGTLGRRRRRGDARQAWRTRAPSSWQPISRVGRPGKMLRRRARGRGRNHPARGRGRARRRLDRGRERQQGQADLRFRARGAARRRCRGSGAAHPGRVRSHGEDRELPARQAGPRRHHPAFQAFEQQAWTSSWRRAA